MEFKFSFTKQPAARSMVARTISEADMLRLTILKLHAANAQNDRLTDELETANQRIKAMQQRNEVLWDSYQDLRSTLNRVESEKTATTAKFGGASSITTSEPVESSLPPAESFCGHCGDCATVTNDSIDELLKRLDKIAGHYGRPYGLPMAHKGTKQLLIDAVRNWVSGNRC